MEKKPENIGARVILDKSTQDLKKVFDYATKISGDLYPRSTTIDGNRQVKSKTKDGTEYFYTLQDRRFPELFEVLSSTNYFKEKMSKLIEPVKYEDFILFTQKAFDPELNIALDNNVKEVCIKALYTFCENERSNFLPRYDFAKDATEEDRKFSGSDLIINILIKLITLGQLI